MSPLKHSNNIAARMGRWSASHWKTAVFGWLAFVVAAFAIGTQRHEADRPADTNVGQAHRPTRSSRAGFRQTDPQTEFVAHPEQDAHGQDPRIPRSGRTTSSTRSRPSRRSRTSARRSTGHARPGLQGRPHRDRRVGHEGRRNVAEKNIDAITTATAAVGEASPRPLHRRGRRASSNKALTRCSATSCTGR